MMVKLYHTKKQKASTDCFGDKKKHPTADESGEVALLLKIYVIDYPVKIFCTLKVNPFAEVDDFRPIDITEF